MKKQLPKNSKKKKHKTKQTNTQVSEKRSCGPVEKVGGH